MIYDMFLVIHNFIINVAIFQWIASCHKNHMTTRVLALLQENNIIFIENMSTSKAIKSYFKGHMIKRILHSWSFHMKFIKLAKGSFNKFHMK